MFHFPRVKHHSSSLINSFDILAQFWIASKEHEVRHGTSVRSKGYSLKTIHTQLAPKGSEMRVVKVIWNNLFGEFIGLVHPKGPPTFRKRNDIRQAFPLRFHNHTMQLHRKRLMSVWSALLGQWHLLDCIIILNYGRLKGRGNGQSWDGTGRKIQVRAA